MAKLTLGHAIRDAVEAEKAAERFYRSVAEGASEAVAKKFLLELAEGERVHAEKIERRAAPATGTTDTFEANPEVQVVELIETAPDWRFVDDVSMSMAIEMAIEGEDHAHLYYAALAGACQGDIAHFFDEMAREEEDHGARLREMRRKLTGG